MVSIEMSVSIREDYFEWILKLCSIVYKDRKPTNKESEFHELTNVIYRDLLRELEEETDE